MHTSPNCHDKYVMQSQGPLPRVNSQSHAESSRGMPKPSAAPRVQENKRKIGSAEGERAFCCDRSVAMHGVHEKWQMLSLHLLYSSHNRPAS